MLFDMKFEVMTIYESGLRVTSYLKGKRKDVKKDIEMYKKQAKNYKMIGKNGMIVWA